MGEKSLISNKSSYSVAIIRQYAVICPKKEKSVFSIWVDVATLFFAS